MSPLKRLMTIESTVTFSRSERTATPQTVPVPAEQLRRCGWHAIATRSDSVGIGSNGPLVAEFSPVDGPLRVPHLRTGFVDRARARERTPDRGR